MKFKRKLYKQFVLLSNSSRKFLFSSDLCIKTKKSFEENTVFLFNDILIVAVKQRTSKISKNSNNYYNVKYLQQLGISLRISEFLFGGKFGFKIECAENKHPLIFLAATKEIQKVWIETILKTMKERKKIV